MPEQTHEDMITANDVAFPALESIDISRCGITGKWLSLMLRHSPALKELYLYGCPQLKQLKIEEEGNVPSKPISASEASPSGYLDDALRSSVRASSGYAAHAQPISVVDGVVHISLNLKKIRISGCPHLIFDGSRERFAGFTSLEEEVEEDGQEKGRCLLPQSLEQLDWSDYPRESLRPWFVGNLTRLKKLKVNSKTLEYLELDSCMALEELTIMGCECLESLQLHSCTKLERLKIWYCSLLHTLEGLRSLVKLKHLEILGSYALGSLTTSESYEPIEGISSHNYELFPALESLEIDGLSPLNTSFCKGLTCLRSLTLIFDLEDAMRLTYDQERALLLLGSLQQLQFEDCFGLVDLPRGLNGLPSLKTLRIQNCNSISGLPNEGLPPLLEELVIDDCSVELSEQCRLLATSKLNVIIYEDYDQEETDTSSN